MEMLSPSNPIYPFVTVDPDRMGGDPCFRGTRVPVRSLFEHICAGDSLDEFLDDFEGVTREQATAVLQIAAQGLMNGVGRAA